MSSVYFLSYLVFFLDKHCWLFFLRVQRVLLAHGELWVGRDLRGCLERMDCLAMMDIKESRWGLWAVHSLSKNNNYYDYWFPIILCVEGEQGEDGAVGLSGKPGQQGKTGMTGHPGSQGSFGPKVRTLHFFTPSDLIHKEPNVRWWHTAFRSRCRLIYCHNRVGTASSALFCQCGLALHHSAAFNSEHFLISKT